MCLRPLHALPLPGVLTVNDKQAYKILSEDDFVRLPADAKSTVTPVPCGRCMECRLNKSREWATRMMLECQYHQSSYFVTLTYDDKNVPVTYYPDLDTGEALPALTLVKSDLQLFMKRLRRRLEYHGRPPIRYYAVGEYGDQTHRPHYHLVIFGLQLDDLELLKRSALGFPYYRSQLIEDCWPNGYSMVCQVSWETCAYVARYCTKKLSGDFAEFYQTFNILPEFALMSRKPGIAYQYFEDHKDEIYRTDEIFLQMASGGKSVKPCRYYDKMYDLENPELMQLIHERRQRKAEAAAALKQRQTNLSEYEQAEARTRVLMQRVAKLVRPDI